MTKYKTIEEAIDELKRQGLYDAWLKDLNKKTKEAKKASIERAIRIEAEERNKTD